MESSFDDALSFMKEYPTDHRYTWIAGLKEEFCIRAIPKKGVFPTPIDRSTTLSKNFKFWIDDFDNHWTNGLISTYIMNHIVMNTI